jgi:predicted nucleic acid-binding protein
VSVFVLDASYTLPWCFPDRATANTDAALKRLEAAAESAVVPPIWQLEVANALGKAVVRRN